MSEQNNIVVKNYLGTFYYNSSQQLHRLNGPAYDCNDGTKMWFVDGIRHRTDGPAVQFRDGDVEYWVDGKWLTSVEFEERTNPKMVEPVKPKTFFKKCLIFKNFLLSYFK